MNAQPAFAPTAAAITVPVQVAANEGDRITFMAVGAALGAGETISINIMTAQMTGANQFVHYFVSGAAVQLTQTITTVTVEGGWLYGLTKTSNAGSPVGCDYALKPRSGVQ